MKRFMVVIALMFAAGVMTGCNTVAGAGKDIERGGEKIQDKAERSK
jgi:entericidin A